ncbi:MAG TPA: hypothetical protein VGM19_08110 [Armatimonadota bacterium]|jgi:hypothetical protein
MSKLLRPRFGPAFLIALVLSGLLLWWRHVQDNQQRGPMIVEHQTPAGVGLVGVPDPTFVREHAAGLGLSADQGQRLAPLAEQWQRETGDLQRRLDAAGQALQGRLAQAQPNRVGPSDMTDAAGEMQVLSRELSAQRQAYWPRLQSILNADQQRRAQEAWADAHRLHVPPRAGK